MAFRVYQKYRKTAAMVTTRSFADQQYLGLAADFLIRLLRVLLLLAIWRSVLAGRGSVSGMSMGAVLTYTLISEVFNRQLTDRSAIDGALWDGSIANRLVRPIGIYGQFVAEMVGGWVPGLLLFSLPLLLAAPWLGVEPLPTSATAGAWFILSLILAVTVGTALDVIFAALMVWFENSIYAMQQIRNAISLLLSGAVIPLALFPWDLGQVLQWLPFAALASAPLRLYTGTGDPWMLVTLQAGWAAVLWPAAHALWQRNREGLVSHGG